VRNQDALTAWERDHAGSMNPHASKELQQCLTFQNQLPIDGGYNETEMSLDRAYAVWEKLRDKLLFLRTAMSTNTTIHLLISTKG
jgi:hypothetical protein